MNGTLNWAERKTNSAYCMGPSFFSWLGSGTSRRIFPEAVSGAAGSACRSSALARFRAVVERCDVEPARISVAMGGLASVILARSETQACVQKSHKPRIALGTVEIIGDAMMFFREDKLQESLQAVEQEGNNVCDEMRMEVKEEKRVDSLSRAHD
jgi:hypothetical protein